MFKKLLVFFVAGCFFIGGQISEAATSFTDVSGQFWAKSEIDYLADEAVVQGFSDGRFRPNDTITRLQAATMLVRALKLETENRPQAELIDIGVNHEAYPIVATVFDEGLMTGRNGYFEPGQPLSRAQMAAILTRAFELQGESAVSFRDVPSSFWAYNDIQALTANRITTGYGDGRFGPNDSTSRAQFSVFLARSLNDRFKPEEQPVSSREVTVSGIGLGDTEQKVRQILGIPAREDISEYGFTWLIYKNDYLNYAQIGIQDGRVVGLLTNGEGLHTRSEVRLGTSREVIRSKYGERVTEIQKGGTIFRYTNQDHHELYFVDNSYVTFFYDSHRQNRLSGIQVIDGNVERSFARFYGQPSAALRRSFEAQVFDLVNASRAHFGKAPLKSDDVAARVARRHSVDMAENAFFSHTNERGESPFDRMENEGMTFLFAGENIAYGQTNAMFAHEGWMNSRSGHREAILGSFTHLGVGVGFNAEGVPYYTQTFYTP
ncbi:CAP-associated domain-containing protein [Halalkalibacterium ligniniphilum]|uniref:CAP-associated domain-containing protein n=1 Tax=Halalkalibacterium ligniniphilum TaxID=1134413 RepID=UPI000345130C|nr:CAP-associated domain-containing protein [Halalkalibacterium ligniniphilum]